jgi:hypothetical protein
MHCVCFLHSVVFLKNGMLYDTTNRDILCSYPGPFLCNLVDMLMFTRICVLPCYYAVSTQMLQNILGCLVAVMHVEQQVPSSQHFIHLMMANEAETCFFPL